MYKYNHDDIVNITGLTYTQLKNYKQKLNPLLFNVEELKPKRGYEIGFAGKNYYYNYKGLALFKEVAERVKTERLKLIKNDLFERYGIEDNTVVCVSESEKEGAVYKTTLIAIKDIVDGIFGENGAEKVRKILGTA